jgi:hypothetical protein
MFKLRIFWLAGLMALLLAGMLPPAGAVAGEPNQAGLVVQSEDGQVQTRCIAFEEDQLNGADLLSRSGLDVVLNPASSMGITVCRIEGLGCDYPAEHCFCQCMGGSGCTYWNYFYREPGGSAWIYSALGAAVHKVQPGSVEGWVWGDGHSAPPDDLTLEAICMPATPTAVLSEPGGPTDTPESPALPTITAAVVDPATVTAVPSQQAASTGTPSALSTATAPVPTATVAVTVLPTPTPAPVAGSSQDLAGYWPFGLMLLSLGIVGAVVWFRRTRPGP